MCTTENKGFKIWKATTLAVLHFEVVARILHVKITDLAIVFLVTEIAIILSATKHASHFKFAPKL